MSAARHWSDFPPALFDLAAKLEANGSLTMENVTKPDAYNIRNEYHRFRRAVARAFHAGDTDPTVRDLYNITRDATLQIAPMGVDQAGYRLTLGKPAISASLSKWKPANGG